MLRRAIESLMRAFRGSFSSVGWDSMSTRLGVSLLVVSAIFFAANFADKAWVSYQVGQAKQQRLAAIAETSTRISQLKHDLSYLHSSAYYRQAARQYGYVEPGDIQLAVTQGAPSQDSVVVRSAQDPNVHPKPHESVLHRLLQAVVPGL
jgi:cell division protein FtsB